MAQADYDRIADRFDDNRGRRHDRDPFLGKQLTRWHARLLVVLDVGCGTGTYLERQLAAYGDESVRWLGLDSSGAMLARAKQKARHALLALGRAEALPFATGSIGYAVTTYAFHHFQDKCLALDEVRRVSTGGAAFRLVNIVPDEMPGWWVYRFFPETSEMDSRRFWAVERLRRELELRGFVPRLEVHRSRRHRSVQDLVIAAERRDTSELDILAEAEYQHGLERLRKALKADPGAVVESQRAVVECRALIRL